MNHYQNALLPIDIPHGKETPEHFNPLDRYVGIGRPGNTGYWGYALSGEQINKLDNGQREGLLIYDQMRRGDSQIKSILQAICLPILSAHYFVEPASESPVDKRIAGLVEDALLTGLNDSWVDTLRHILLFLPFGFSYLEKIYRYKSGLAMPIHLAPRLPLSIYRWMATMETGRLYEIWQLDSNGKLYKIPVEKLIMFVNEREGDNWVGMSLLRPAYKNWFVKNELEKIDAIKHERHGVGVPMVTPRDGAKPNSVEWDAAREVTERYQAGENTGLVLPFGYKMEILTPGGASGGGTDIITSIRYHNEEMARSVLAMFSQLGTTSGGNRALGETFLQIFTDSIQWVADYICGRLTQDLIRECVRMNWGDIPYPTLKVGRIEKLPTETLAALATAGIIVPDSRLESAVRKSMNLPERDIETQTATAGSGEDGEKPVVSRAPDPKSSSETGRSDIGLSERRAKGHPAGCACGGHANANGKQLAARMVSAKEVEYCARFIDIPAYAMQLSSAEQGLRQSVMRIREMQVRSVVKQLVDGRKIPFLKVPLKKELFEALHAAYLDQRVVGAEQVRRELGRQGMTLAEGDPVPPEAVMRIGADEIMLGVEGTANRAAGILSETFLEGKRLGLDGWRLRKYLEDNMEEDLGSAAWEDLVGGAIGRGWNDGREAEAAEAIKLGMVESAHYSPVFDANLCAVCLKTYEDQGEDDEGEKFHAPGDPAFAVPNAECMGGTERCRCINIYISGGVFAKE